MKTVLVSAVAAVAVIGTAGCSSPPTTPSLHPATATPVTTAPTTVPATPTPTAALTACHPAAGAPATPAVAGSGRRAVPTARTAAGIAFDGVTNRLLMFGTSPPVWGLPVDPHTYAWDASGWRVLDPSASPSPRYRPAMAWDPKTAQVVLFGSHVAPSYAGPIDTWVWNGQTWRRVVTSSGPTRSENPVLTWDDASQQLVLTGVGSDYAVPAGASQELMETWVWGGNTWVRVDDGHATPQTMLPLDTAYDPVSRRLISVEGTLTTMWSWSAGRWSQLAAASPSIEDIVTDYAHGCVLGITPFLGTWGWTGTDWVRVHADDDPSVSTQASFAPDAAVGGVAEYGVVPNGTTASPHVYTWTGSSWTAQKD